MLILISLDFIDTTYRITYGYFSGQGVQPPVGDFNVQLSTLDFIVSIVFQLAIAYTIYMLYNMKRSGGYYLVGLNILFVIYGFILGPFSTVPAGEVIPLIAGFMVLYIILVIGIPYLYSDKYE
jgi:hypothetical protein